MKKLTTYLMTTFISIGIAHSQEMKMVKTPLSNINCQTKIFDIQGQKIQISISLKNLMQISYIDEAQNDVYEATLKESALTSGTGNAKINTKIDQKSDARKETISSIQLSATSADDMQDVQQFLNAGMTQEDISKVKLYRFYELDSSILPIVELLNEKGTVLFRYIVAEADGNSQYVYACK